MRAGAAAIGIQPFYPVGGFNREAALKDVAAKLGELLPTTAELTDQLAAAGSMLSRPLPLLCTHGLFLFVCRGRKDRRLAEGCRLEAQVRGPRARQRLICGTTEGLRVASDSRGAGPELG